MASSMDTLPVPAPISQQTSSGSGFMSPRTAIRIICLVMGTFPRINSASGIPGRERLRRGIRSAMSTESGAKDMPAASPAVQAVILSSG